MPTIPRELMDQILEYAIYERDPAALRALLQTSSVTRLRAIQPFVQPQWYECEQMATHRTPKLRVPLPFITFMHEVLAYYLLDATTRRHGAPRPVAPLAAEDLLAPEGRCSSSLSFELTLETDPLPIFEHGGAPKSKRRKERQSRVIQAFGSAPTCVTLQQACQALNQAVSQLGPAPRFANPLLRTRNAYDCRVDGGGTLVVSLTMDGSWSRQWRFDSLSSRPNANF